MPIKIPDDLPARATLSAEGVMVMREGRVAGILGRDAASPVGIMELAAG